MSIFDEAANAVYKKGFFEEVTAGCDMYDRVKCVSKSYPKLKRPLFSSSHAVARNNSALGKHVSNITPPLSHEKVRPEIPPELYDKRALAYHTEPPKRDYDISDIQLRTPYNRREFDDLNEDFVKTITENYYVRSLSEVARQYGFYSVFIVGEEFTYFVYGIDNEYLNTTRFIEYDGSLYPYEYVRENGYSKGEAWLNFYWNVITVEHFLDPNYMFNAIEQINMVEFLRYAYRDAGMPLPQYVVLGKPETMTYLKSRHWMATSDKYEGSMKQHYRNMVTKTLEDIAIWNWPIKKSDDCGYLAFILGTRYNAFSYLSYSDKDFIFKNPGRWNATLRAAEAYNEKAFVDQDFCADEAKFIMAHMTGRGLPCREVETRSKLEDKETDMAISLFSSDKERKAYDYRTNIKTLRYCTFDIGLVQYLEEEYTEHVLSDECMDYGDMLLNEMTEQDPNDSTSHTGLVVELIDSSALDYRLKMASYSHINYGHPRDWRFRLPFSKGVYMVTPYYNIALSVNNRPFANDNLHWYNSTYEMYTERRGFSPAYDGRMWRTDYYKDDMLNGLSPRTYTNDLVKKGYIVSNDGMDIPIADDDTLSQSF